MSEQIGSAIEQPIKIYPRSVKGRFRNFKNLVLLVAYGVYFGLPWVPWERTRGADQAILWDLEGRRFYLFDMIIHPQDIFWLAGFLIVAAMLLFMVTGMAGRVFCGYFCFQTLWTDFFRIIETRIQGERPARIRLDKQPWNLEKILKKGSTHALWLLTAFWTGFTFTAYWTYAPELLVDFFTLKANSAAYTTTFILTATTYLTAGLIKENVCAHICPYSRFQGAMFDKETLIVSYDVARGEGAKGRAKPVKDLKDKAARDAAGVGDCVDCELCVQVCPTGIDIREGLQYKCISCGLCIDACDQIMDSKGWPRGLIRYDSEIAMEEGRKQHLWRPKTIGYGVAVLLVTVLTLYGVAQQSAIDMTVRQIRNPLFVTLSDGRVQNVYEVKVNNKVDHGYDLAVRVEGLEGAELDFGQLKTIHAEPDKLVNVQVKVKYRAKPEEKGVKEIVFVVEPSDPTVPTLEYTTNFHLSR